MSSDFEPSNTYHSVGRWLREPDLSWVQRDCRHFFSHLQEPQLFRSADLDGAAVGTTVVVLLTPLDNA